MGVTVVRGLLGVLAIGLAPLAVLLLVLAATRRSREGRCLPNGWPLRRRRVAEPTGRPIEELAADLRRLYPAAHFPRPGVRMPKQRGVLMAYDQRLVETAEALGVASHLTDCPLEGYDRSAERLRLELALAEAGLVWRVDPAA